MSCSHHNAPHKNALIPDTSANPILVEKRRGDLTENIYRGSYVIVDTKGTIHETLGDAEKIIYPRSAIKPIQAIPFVESGACDEYGCSDIEIALACASHNGEDSHVKAVQTWLERIGLSEQDLECAAHDPMRLKTALELAGKGQKPSRLHNNCSGKHAAFLSLAKKLNVPTKNYIKFHHPVQQSWLGTLEMLSQMMLNHAPKGIDGCGIPQLGMPLGNLALAMAHFGAPSNLPDKRAEACLRIQKAIHENAYYIAGTERFCSAANQALGGKALIKIGADGVYAACIPEHNIGIALKIDDGNSEAATLVMAHLLKKCNVLGIEPAKELSNYLAPNVTNWAGLNVGEYTPTDWAK